MMEAPCSQHQAVLVFGGLHDYFVRVAHRSSTTEKEFRSSVEELEQILLASFCRKTSKSL